MSWGMVVPRLGKTTRAAPFGAMRSWGGPANDLGGMILLSLIKVKRLIPILLGPPGVSIAQSTV